MAIFKNVRDWKSPTIVQLSVRVLVGLVAAL